MTQYDDEESEETENSELEAEFKALCDAHMSEINEQIDVARVAIRKAVELSEKYGIPFSSDITPLGMSYCPDSYYGKFDELDKGFVSEVAGASLWNMYGGSGWEHSDVC